MDQDFMTDQEQEEPAADDKNWLKFWLIFGSFLVLLFLLNKKFNSLSLTENRLKLFYNLIILVWLSSYFAFSGKLREKIKHASIWIVVAIVMAAGYSYRFELKEVKVRILSNLAPEYGVAGSERTMEFNIANDGHYYIRAEIGNEQVRFLVDTGASDIVITPRVAERLGYDLDSLPFNRVYQTANGTGRGSNITLPGLRIGDLDLTDVPASVNKAPMNSSLLGMSFFNRLKSYKFENQKLVIEWQQ